MTVQVAFFIGNKSSIIDKLVRIRTQSNVCHVEIVIDDKKYSSYPGIGVRVADFIYSVNDWILVNMPKVDKNQILNLFEMTKGRPYDWLAVTIGQFFYIKLHSPNAYFCSEWVAEALGFPEPSRFTPALLKIILENKNLIID